MIKVGNDGYVKLIDSMGTDLDIVEAARISFNRHQAPLDIDKDRHLIRYLMRHRHTTPFEMVEFKFLVRVPMDTWRQWIRHRTASVNEYSTRYTEAIDSRATTKPDEWRLQSKVNKQGSVEGTLSYPENFTGSKDIDPGTYLSTREILAHEYFNKLYQERLEFGVAREQARKDLPLSTYTEAYWKIDLHNLFHFLKLRLAKDAQKEIRDYAEAIGNLVKPIVPVAWEAFEDYVLGSINFSRQEMIELRKMVEDKRYLHSGEGSREQREFYEKLFL